MTEKKVFIVQRPSFRTADGSWADKYDLTPAEHFGTPVEVLPRGNVPKQLEVTLTRLRVALKEYRDGDYILAVGDPIAIGLAVAIACHNNGGRVNLLKWDRIRQEYRAYVANAW